MKNPTIEFHHLIHVHHLSWIIFFLFLFSASGAICQEWTYTVQPGDNLWKISKKHLVSMRYWKDVQQLNNIKDPTSIPPGSMLRFRLEWLKTGATVSTLTELTGEATIVERITGKVKQARKGMFLWDYDVIRTMEGSSATLQFADGSKVLLQENSELKVEKLISYGSTGMAETKVRLQKGRVHNKVIPKKGPGSRFEISTPSAIAAVRGTEYRISAEDNGESKAEVVKGEVGVDSAGVSNIVPGGFGTISYTDHEPLEPVKLLEAPDLSTLPSKIIRVPFPLQLKPINGAVVYRMQISEKSEFDNLLFDSVFSGKIWVPDLPDKAYYLRIHGVDEQGLEGLDSVHPFSMEAHPVSPMQVQPVAEAVTEESMPTFRWSEPQKAVTYRFQLSRDDKFSQLVAEKIDHGKSLYKLEQEIPPGVYFWRTASVDDKGKVGPYSDHQQFRRTPPSPDMSDSKLDLDEMAFRWRKGEPGQKYRCQISKDSSFATTLVDEEVSDPQYSLKNFDPASYFIRVAVIDTDGFAGPFSPYQTVGVPMPPTPTWAYFLPLICILVIIL